MTAGTRMTRRMALGAMTLTVLTAATAARAEAGPLKVYILAGQSNMQGKARPSTLPAMAQDPETKALHDKIVDADGKPQSDDGACEDGTCGSREISPCL